jgi:hypothetical protein
VSKLTLAGINFDTFLSSPLVNRFPNIQFLPRIYWKNIKKKDLARESQYRKAGQLIE